MFDKTQERIRRLEETNETFRKVSYYFQENKKIYLVGVSCFGVGIVGGKYIKKPINVSVENTPVFNNNYVIEVLPLI